MRTIVVSDRTGLIRRPKAVAPSCRDAAACPIGICMSLSGKTALVTGGTRGIGRSTALALAQQGARVVVMGRTEVDLAAVAKEVDGLAIRVDQADRASVDQALVELASRAGRVDILVNNAGIAESAALERSTDAMWDRIMEVNAGSAFRLCRALVPSMVRTGWGRVVNVASNAGVSGYKYTAAYCASKHAMVGFTRALAVDLATTGVTINAICPGWVDTKMATDAVERIQRKTGRTEQEARGALEQMSPQHRMIEPAEVAHLVVSLCSDLARGIHGQAIVIDGGQILK